MPVQKCLHTFRDIVLPAVMNSYSIIFFFNNKLLAGCILLITFFNFYAGLSGLLAVLVTVLIANSMGLDKATLKAGLYSFNALLTGIGMGTFFDPSLIYFCLLLIASLISLLLSVTIGGNLFKHGLPFLSIPFVITFWLILLPSSQFENLGLTQRSIYWMNNVYAIGGNSLLNVIHSLDTLPVNNMVGIYLRSISSIFFQDNLITGAIIALALLICSRITFSLSVIGFLAAYLFAKLSGSAAASITYYNIGANYIMVAIAIGGFFVIPSTYSYLWTIILIPVTSLILLFLSKLLGFINLPVFSLPFSIVVILFVYFLLLRIHPSKLILTPIQYYSPEINLYTFTNNEARRSNFLYFPFHLPFWGEWTVTQGHDGKHTHKGDWGKAYDFMLFDDESKTHNSNGSQCEHYYCYNKPVIAPADGTVEYLIDNSNDNEIGQVNTTNNWGNSIIIRHLPGLYTQLSHLKKGTFKVAKGDFVKQGDLLAHCGNSGRSPEPHLHFQVQALPLPGSRTIDYPIAYYNEKEESGLHLHQFCRPVEGAMVSGIMTDSIIKKAFEIIPNTILKYTYLNEKGLQKTEQWEAYTDAYNNKYLYCKETESSAYYINDGSMFYFTAFYGNQKSLLYYFYLSFYKVFLGELDSGKLETAMPLHVILNKKAAFRAHDFIAPFTHFIRVWYTMEPDNPINYNTDMVILKSDVRMKVFGKTTIESNSTITLTRNGIMEFEYESRKTKIQAKWLNT